MSDSYDIFLSYSRRDNDIMRRVKDTLKEEGFSVWLDTEVLMDLDPRNPQWQDGIENGIKSSRSLVVLLSPDANQSEYVKGEITYARTHDVPVIPFLVRGTQQDAVPYQLINYQRAQLGNDYEKSLYDLLVLITNQLDLPATPLMQKIAGEQEIVEAKLKAQQAAQLKADEEARIEAEVQRRLREREDDYVSEMPALMKFFRFDEGSLEKNQQGDVAFGQKAWITFVGFFAKLGCGFLGYFIFLGILGILSNSTIAGTTASWIVAIIAVLLSIIVPPTLITSLYIRQFNKKTLTGKISISNENKPVLHVNGKDNLQIHPNTRSRWKKLTKMQTSLPYDTNREYRVHTVRLPNGNAYVLSVEPVV